MDRQNRGCRPGVACILTVVLVLAMSPNADARQLFSPTLHPKTYVAPAGHYALFIDPSNRDGAGNAAYRLSQDGRVVWSATLPFTLWEADVADDGVVCGYAYSQGYSEVGARRYSDDKGDFSVVILDASGIVRVQDKVKRYDPSGVFSEPPMPPFPTGHGLLLDSTSDRLVVRSDRWEEATFGNGWSDEIWSAYRLSTGRLIARFAPKALMQDAKWIGYVVAARLVPGTPLTLVDWQRADDAQNIGVRFTLVNPVGNTVWSLDLSQDYSVRGKPVATYKIEFELESDGAIQHTDPPGRFTLRFVAAGQQVAFAVTPAGSDRWKVVEVGRRRYNPARPNPGMRAPNRALRPLGKIVLRSPDTPGEPAVRGVGSFIRVGRDRFAFVRSDRLKHSELVVIDAAGRVRRVVNLKAAYGPEVWGKAVYAWIGGTRILFTTELDTAWWIDFETGRITRCPSLHGLERIQAIAAFADGGFVVLADASVLRAFDAAGRRMWSVTKDRETEPSELSSPEGVTVTSDQKVAVLDSIPHSIQLFDRRGKYLRTIDLQRAWGREPSYPAYIAPDRNGGFVVSDFMAPISVVRMSADGKVTSQLAVRYPDGRTFSVLDGAKVGPDGRIWMCDGEALVRLNGKGVVDRVLGERPNPLRLRAIDRLAIDPAGQIYALADRTSAVHLFDASGRWKRVFMPRPTDFDEQPDWGMDLVLGRYGDVYVGGARNGGFVHFAPDETGRGVQPFDQFSDATKRSADPRQGDHWIRTKLLDASGAVLVALNRRPDGDWLENHTTVTTSVAPDGSVAVLNGVSPPFDGSHRPVPTVSLYSAQGAPVRTLRLPVSPQDIAYDGKLLLVAGAERVLAFTDRGRALWEFHPRLPGQLFQFQPFITDGGRVLALFDGQDTVYRYALP